VISVFQKTLFRGVAGCRGAAGRGHQEVATESKMEIDPRVELQAPEDQQLALGVELPPLRVEHAQDRLETGGIAFLGERRAARA
jgi:hypothetical protein